MKIGILTIQSPSVGGVYQYTLSLLEALKLIKNNNFEFIQIRYKEFPKILDKDIILDNQSNYSPIIKLKRLIHIYTNLKLGDLVTNLSDLSSLDLIISPIITLLPYHLKKPYMVTIHDFQHKYYPKFFKLAEKIEREILYKTGQRADFVICESNFVKQDVMKFLKVSEDKIKVIISPPARHIQEVIIDENKMLNVKIKYNLPEKYLFYPAQFWYHKNHIRLLHAINLIKSKYGEIIPLILVGSKKNNFEKTMKEINKLKLSEQVKYLGYVPEEEMPYLYKLATSLVMPTLFESVSIPIWEAFYLECPVVASNICALPEQIGDAGLLFDPYSIEDMAEKIYKIWIDENIRKEFIQKGHKRVKDLSIENYSKQWEDIIENIYKKFLILSEN